MCKYRHWLRFVISLRIRFREWTAGKFPTYFSRDTKCLDHNMSMISCKLVHPFFFVQTSLFKRWSPIYQADIYHSSSISGSFLNTSEWAALERCLSCLFPDSIWVFSGFKTAFYFINTRYQIMMRCWKRTRMQGQHWLTQETSWKIRKPFIRWRVTDSWWCFEIKGWWHWLKADAWIVSPSSERIDVILSQRRNTRVWLVCPIH